MKIKKFNKSIFVSLLVLTLLSVSFLTGCTPEETSDNGNRAIKLGVTNYLDTISVVNLAGAVLEDKMGYDGELDAYVATWLPVTHGPYLDAIKDNVEDLGINYKGIRIGLVVPDYVDINSIEELNANKEKFNGEIIGLDPAAGITEAVFKVMEDYDLDFTQIESNEAALIAALSAAIDNEEWIVVAGWVPHWKFNEWDLKFLDDPKESFGEEENIHVLAANGFSEEMPEAAQFLGNFFLTAEEMSSLMAMVDQADANNASGAVREWIEENEATVQSWLP